MQITVTSPCDFQVFQRSAHNHAVIPVQVEGAVPGRRLVARLMLTDNSAWRGQSTDWFALEEQGGRCVGFLDVPAGGWYRLEVGEPGGPPLATVPRVGVGEVFLVAGQSNAANFGEPALQARDARVATTDGAVWRHGDDPMQGTHGNGGGSPWPVLGDLLARSLQMPIAFLDVAQGGSHTWEWLPATNRYYPRLVTAGQRLGLGGARALLWDQGQSDVIGGSSGARRGGYYQRAGGRL